MFHRIEADRRPRGSPRILLAAFVLVASVSVVGIEARAARPDDASALAASAPVYTSTLDTLRTGEAKAAAALRTSRTNVRATRHQSSAGNTTAAFLGPTIPRAEPRPSGIAFDSPGTPSLPNAPGGVGVRAPPTS